MTNDVRQVVHELKTWPASGEATREIGIRICNDCYEMKGEMCHEPECVFCRRTMAEVGAILDVLMIRPVVSGERLDLHPLPPAPEGSPAKRERCWACEGDGDDGNPLNLWRCTTCNGTGYMPVSEANLPDREREAFEAGWRALPTGKSDGPKWCFGEDDAPVERINEAYAEYRASVDGSPGQDVNASLTEADASPAKDPIAAAVNAQLDPLKDELIKAGHKLAKEDAPAFTCPRCGDVWKVRPTTSGRCVCVRCGHEWDFEAPLVRVTPDTCDQCGGGGKTGDETCAECGGYGKVWEAGA